LGENPGWASIRMARTPPINAARASVSLVQSIPTETGLSMSFRMNSHRKDGGGRLNPARSSSGSARSFFSMLCSDTRGTPSNLPGGLFATPLVYPTHGVTAPNTVPRKSGPRVSSLQVGSTRHSRNTEHGTRITLQKFALPYLFIPTRSGPLALPPTQPHSCMARNFPQPQRLLDTSRQID